MRCPSCGSSFLTQTDKSNADWQGAEFHCRDCHKDYDQKESAQIIKDAIEDQFPYWPPDGEDPTTEECPECSGVYVIELGTCVLCGFEFSGECMLCGESLTLEDYQEGDDLCEYHRYKMHKAMDE